MAAVIGGLLGAAPGAQAAPPRQDGAAARGTAQTSAPDGVPAVWPRPHTLRAAGGPVPVGEEAALVADRDADPRALDTVRDVLRSAGVRTVRAAPPGPPPPGRGLVVRVGDTAAGEALRALRAPGRGDLPPGGYRLAVGRVDGRDTVALTGVDEEGLFHAVQTLRQLAVPTDGGHAFAGVVVRDWPAAAVRGTAEGFYGEAWSQRERLAHLDFMGRTKQNFYLYAPGDDHYRQSRWREAYPARQRADFRELAERARRNHVVLGWALSPGQSLCFASADDRAALLRKLDAVAALGFGAVQLRFDDVGYGEWHCAEDADRYGSGPRAAATAHAELVNAVAAHLAERHGGMPLSVMPTEFYQDGPTEYRRAFAERLDPDVEVAWTGVGVVPSTITGGDLAEARGVFRRPLVTLDNYPVNDYAGDRVFLGPYTGRDPAVASGSAALLANAMEQAAASRVPLFTAADYAWNPRGYRPRESWHAAIGDLAGTAGRTGGGRSGADGAAAVREALHALAANSASSVLGGEESAYLQPALDAFWDTQAGEDDRGFDAAAGRLRAAFRVMREAPAHLADVADGALAEEAGPWIRQLARYGRAGEHAVDMLAAQRRGDGPAAWKAQLEVQRLQAEAARSRATVGKGVLPDFVERALRAADAWAGARDRPEPAGGGDGGSGGRRGRGEQERTEHGGTPSPARPGERVRGGPAPRPGTPLEAAADGDPATAFEAAAPPGADGLVLRLPRPRPLEAVTVQSEPGSGTLGVLEAHVAGEGWRRLGELSDRGWTEVRTGGLRADALRLAWRRGSAPPVVHELTPWYSDVPPLGLELARREADAVIGGDAVTVAARLTGRRPADVDGRLTVRAPEGFTVRAPRRVAVRRGIPRTVGVEVTAGAGVRPGVHAVQVVLRTDDGAARRETLTVRAFPPAGGPDLARGARAASSADETPDFPASAVTDGDPGTRWSSPAEDGQWVQVELDRPAPVGQVVLHWQEAHAARYRIRVSPDGRRWRTAAAVREGRGGRESVRMAAPPDTRFVRVVTDERATRYGSSLWGVEVYAARE